MPAERSILAKSFGSVAGDYERFRPGYPPAAVAAAAAWAQDVLDLGAGTGKLTAQLTELEVRVTAVEPDAQMLAVLRAAAPSATAILGDAEHIPVPDSCTDVVTVGQAMHWFNLDIALPEIRRVLQPNGRLSMLWNHVDVRDPFTAAYLDVIDRTVRPPDGATSGAKTPPFADVPDFTDPSASVIRWNWLRTPEQLKGTLRTYSYVINAHPEARQALFDGIDELIAGLTDALQLAQTCTTWTATAR